MQTLINGPALRKKLGNISRDTLLRWREKNGLPFVKLPNSRVLYNQEDIDNWLDKYKSSHSK